MYRVCNLGLLWRVENSSGGEILQNLLVTGTIWGLHQKNGREETSLEGLFSSLLMGGGMGLRI